MLLRLIYHKYPTKLLETNELESIRKKNRKKTSVEETSLFTGMVDDHYCHQLTGHKKSDLQCGNTLANVPVDKPRR